MYRLECKWTAIILFNGVGFEFPTSHKGVKISCLRLLFLTGSELYTYTPEKLTTSL